MRWGIPSHLLRYPKGEPRTRDGGSTSSVSFADTFPIKGKACVGTGKAVGRRFATCIGEGLWGA